MSQSVTRNPLSVPNDADFRKLKELEENEDLDFLKAVEILELDPKNDFRSADLTGIDFDGLDLTAFSFEGSKFDPGALDKATLHQNFEHSSQHTDTDQESPLATDDTNNGSDDSKTVGWFRDRASEGSADAMMVLGSMYLAGRFVAKDSREGVKWLEKGAQRGDENAAFLLANCYLGGVGVASNLEEAVKWYTAAAEEGHLEAMVALGVAYRDGTGVEVDIHKSLRWFREAATKGHRSATLEMAMFQVNHKVSATVGVDEESLWPSWVITQHLPSIVKDKRD